jgi:hypothetical protein
VAQSPPPEGIFQLGMEETADCHHGKRSICFSNLGEAVRFLGYPDQSLRTKLLLNTQILGELNQRTMASVRSYPVRPGCHPPAFRFSPAVSFYGVSHYSLQFLPVQRLGQIIVGPALNGFNPQILFLKPGGKNDLCLGADLLNRREKIKTFFHRMIEVDQNNLEGRGRQQTFSTSPGCVSLDTALLQRKPAEERDTGKKPK